MLIDQISPDLLAKYKSHELSSRELANILGCHPQSLRRAIQRPKRVAQPTNKTEYLRIRHLYRMSIAHLSIAEIADKASVSASTARRIKAQWKELQKERHA